VEPVRFGLLSTASIAEHLIGPLRASPLTDPVAVASRDGDRAAAWAARHGVPRSHGSYEALLADDAVEVVYVPLPNALHGQWARAALEAGKHVLCEKPLTAGAQEAQELYELAAARGLVLAEAVMYRHHPQTELLQRIVARRLGPLRALHAAFHYPIDGLDGDVRARPELAGGALRDLGIYCVSVLNLLAGGEPLEVAGKARRHAGGVDAGFAASLTYDGGVQASFDCSMDSALSLWLVVTGQHGTLTVPNPFQPGRPWLWAPRRCPAEASLATADGDETLELPGGDPYRHEIEDLARAVRGGDGFVVPAHETVGVLRTIDRLLAAAGMPA
jgi:D-xylose 1-dehydrogenase (NADP+, D-xylono-1,5-lactone-forming)